MKVSIGVAVKRTGGFLFLVVSFCGVLGVVEEGGGWRERG